MYVYIYLPYPPYPPPPPLPIPFPLSRTLHPLLSPPGTYPHLLSPSLSLHSPVSPLLLLSLSLSLSLSFSPFSPLSLTALAFLASTQEYPCVEKPLYRERAYTDTPI